ALPVLPGRRPALRAGGGQREALGATVRGAGPRRLAARPALPQQRRPRREPRGSLRPDGGAVRQGACQPLAAAVRQGRRAGGTDELGGPGAGTSDRACARHAGGDRRHPDGRQPDEAVRLAAAAGAAAAAPGPAQRRNRPGLRFLAAVAAVRGGDPVIGRLAPPWDGLLLDARLATLRDDLGAYGAIDDGVLAWKEGLIAWAGPRAELPGEPEALARRV